MGKTFVEDERPCDSCVNVTRYGCASWNCEYINRDEAKKAWREKHETADRKTENCSEKPNNCKDLQDWKDRMWAEAIVTEPTISKMEQVEDEPQPNADQHTQDVGSVGSVEQTEMPEYEAWKEPFEAMTDCPWK